MPSRQLIYNCKKVKDEINRLLDFLSQPYQTVTELAETINGKQGKKRKTKTKESPGPQLSERCVGERKVVRVVHLDPLQTTHVAILHVQSAVCDQTLDCNLPHQVLEHPCRAHSEITSVHLSLMPSSRCEM